VRDAKACGALAGIAGEIECKTIKETFAIEEIAEWAPPVEADRYVVRVKGVIGAFLERTRAAMIQEERENEGRTAELVEIVRLFVRALLTLEGGALAPVEALWEVFEAIRDAKIGHVEFGRFVEIMENDPEVNAVLAGTRRKVIAVLYALLSRGLLPSVMMFMAGIAPTGKIASPFYWADPANVLKLAGAFRALKDVPVELAFTDFERVADLT
jgi:hypothetical protein